MCSISRAEPQPGVQDPRAPHPGTITVSYAWNDTRDVLDARTLPDSFIFRCNDANGELVGRDSAVSCVPVVAIETISRDKAGRLVSPSNADTIVSLVFGPGHVLLESVESGPRDESGARSPILHERK